MNRIDRLTSVRGFAALYVLLFHCQNTLPWFNLGRLNGFADKGYLAVDFFFVLSGFILGYVYLRDVDAGRHRQVRFLALRLARIYPAHLLTLLLALLITRLPGFAQHAWLDYDLATFISNLLLIHSWGLHHNLSWNYVSWSISAEWFAYLMFPLFAWASAVARGRARLACLLAAGLLLLLAVVTGWLHLPAGVAVSSGNFLRLQPAEPFSLAADFGVVRVGFEFCAGMMMFRAYEVWRLQPPRWTGAATALTVVALFAVLGLHWQHTALLQDAVAVLLIAVLILLLGLDHSRISRPLDSRTLIYIGEISYSLYMMHGIAFLLYFAGLDAGWFRKPASPTAAYGYAAAVLAFSVAGGVLSYHLVETPLRNGFKRWLDRRSAPAVPRTQVPAQAQR